MPKKKPNSTKSTDPPQVVRKQLLMPADWAARIDELRGSQSFADFVRDAVAEKIGRRGLSEMPAWGQGRPRKNP